MAKFEKVNITYTYPDMLPLFHFTSEQRELYIGLNGKLAQSKTIFNMNL